MNDMPVSATGLLEITLDDGLELTIAEYPTHTMASLWRGKAREGALVHVSLKQRRGTCRVSEKVDGIWFGDTFIRLPWLQLLQVADFLWLPIPAEGAAEGVAA